MWESQSECHQNIGGGVVEHGLAEFPESPKRRESNNDMSDEKRWLKPTCLVGWNEERPKIGEMIVFELQKRVAGVKCWVLIGFKKGDMKDLVKCSKVVAIDDDGEHGQPKKQ